MDSRIDGNNGSLEVLGSTFRLPDGYPPSQDKPGH
jgi:hypothetical protein